MRVERHRCPKCGRHIGLLKNRKLAPHVGAGQWRCPGSGTWFEKRDYQRD